MKMSSILLCFILSTAISSTYGWGPIGHSIVAHLAQKQLDATAAEWTRLLIPWHWNGNLSSMASWADNILYPDSNPHGFDNWQWSRPLHYVNVPDGNCRYQSSRDCLDDVCVDGAIRNYSRRLATHPDEIQRQEALYFLIHYVADIHQPLHTGFVGDRGGNSVRGHFMNISAQTNLHSLWDSGIINYRMQKSFNSSSTRYHEYIYQLMLLQNPMEDDNDIEQWIREDLDVVCSQIYFDDSFNRFNSSISFHLGESYYQRSWPVIEQRLVQGGRRLGALLNRLAHSQSISTTTATTTATTATGVSVTLILVGVLGGGFLLAIVVGLCVFIIYLTRRNKANF